MPSEDEPASSEEEDRYETSQEENGFSEDELTPSQEDCLPKNDEPIDCEEEKEV